MVPNQSVGKSLKGSYVQSQFIIKYRQTNQIRILCLKKRTTNSSSLFLLTNISKPPTTVQLKYLSLLFPHYGSQPEPNLLGYFEVLIQREIHAPNFPQHEKLLWLVFFFLHINWKTFQFTKKNCHFRVAVISSSQSKLSDEVERCSKQTHFVFSIIDKYTQQKNYFMSMVRT